MKSFSITSLILFFLYSNSISAQERFKKAYVIDNNQQKINGSIDFGNPIRNPAEIIFLDSSTLKISVFSPNDIQSFSVKLDEERRYESRIVQITDYPEFLEGLDDSGVPNIITDTVFVEVLVKGKASLFHYMDEKKWDHFFIEKADTFQTLMQVLVRHDMMSKQVLVLRQRYKTQLNLAFLDCPNILERIYSVENTIPSLQKIFEDYNNCLGKENEFVKNRKTKQHLKFAFNVGYQVAKLTVRDVKIGDAAYIEELDFPLSRRLPIGLSVEIPFPKNYSIYNELLYTEFGTNAGYTIGQESHILYFRYTYLQYLMALRYHFNKDKKAFSPFVNVGGTMSYGFAKSYALVVNNYYYLPQVVSNQEPLLTPKLFPASAVFGFGFNYKKYSLELRMSYNTGVSYHYDMKSNILAGCLMMTYSPWK